MNPQMSPQMNTSSPFSPSRRVVARTLASVLAGISLFALLPATADTSLSAKLTPILAGSHRSDANRARDAYRHPLKTLEFFGVKPGQSVIEITPAPGWYTEVLAPLLQSNGEYTAALVSNTGLSEKGVEFNTKRMAAFKEKLQADPVHYKNVKIVEFVNKAPMLGPDNSADVVLTFRNVHNWVSNETYEAMFKAMFAVLKPGGVLGVVDHRAGKKQDLKAALENGYLPEEFVIEKLQKAGFKLEAKSKVNNNPKDTKDYAEGVWTLPPVLTLKDKDKAKYMAIGESDRFTLRFVKPKNS
jgi:predicted methyltransferase